MPLWFQILSRSRTSSARLGRITTPHGAFDTPAFMPVGTRGAVKGLLPSMVAATGAQIILGNTYHLMLRPGAGLVERMGGLHRFTGWRGPMLTDSGGYQAFSMSDINRVTDEGVTFKSIVDGSMVSLSPESAIAIQNQLGADIIMAFDDCPPSVEKGTADRGFRIADLKIKPKPGEHAARVRQANERTVRWLERCKREHERLGGHEKRALFGIVQGGTDLEQRSWSVERVCGAGGVELPGYAIGGVAVGESPEDIERVVRHTAPLMPEAKPRYLMGVGYERDLFAAVRAGVDMFDCVLPTRNGRNASAFTSTGSVRFRNAKYAEDPGPIEAGCDCPACGGVWESARDVRNRPDGGAQRADSHFSRAYIRHLFLSGEMLGPILVSLHNLRHFQRFMADIRATIASDDWEGLVGRWPVIRTSESGSGDG